MSTIASSVNISSRSLRTLYVGNLPGDVREKEIEDIFYKYGRIAHVDLKVPPKPPGYAFVEFEEARDAEDAIDGRDGYEFAGFRLRVELARGGRGSAHSSPSDRHSSRSAGRGFRGGVSKRSEYRVMVTGLPSSASWQDLKDHMRAAGDVCFSQVFRAGKGTAGIVDYTNYEDMKYAIKKLDDSEFCNAFSRGYIRVKEHDSKRDRSRSRSRSLSGRSRSHSKSPRAKSSREKSPKRKSSRRSRSRSVSRSRSQSPLRPLSRSPSISKSPASSRKKVEDKSHKKRSPSWSPKQEKSKSPWMYKKFILARHMQPALGQHVKRTCFARGAHK